MFTLRRTIAATLILTFPSVSASAPSAGGSQTADQHFRVGVYAFQQHSLDVAVREFEAAYEASPHYAVLYNLGLAYAEQGRPAEAVETLQRYVREGGTRIPTDREQSVRKAILENEKKLGELVLEVSPDGASVWIDGHSRNVDKPLALAEGKHTISVKAPDRSPDERTIEIRPAKRTELKIALQREPASGQGTAAALRISCRIPAVDVSIDGRSLGRFTGVLPVAPGSRRLVFSRTGYDDDGHELTVKPGDVHDAECALRAQKGLPTGEKARFSIHSSLPDATILVDGSKYRNEWLPAGTHRVSVTCDECVAWFHDASLVGGETRTMSAEVDLLPSARARLESEYAQRRTWTWISGGTGLALGVTAAVLFATNQGRTDAWNDEGARLGAELNSGNPPDQQLFAEILAHDQEALSIQRTATVALGTAILGGALLGVATFLYFTTEPAPKANRRMSKSAFSPGFTW